MRYHFTSEYFDRTCSIAYRIGPSIKSVLSTVAAHYIGQNPPIPFQFRAFDTRGFRALQNGQFNLNLSSKWPEAAPEQIVYICARFYQAEAGSRILDINCYGPTRIYVNGQEIFRSNVHEEVNSQIGRQISMPFLPGLNSLVIGVKKVATGFGCRIGPYEARQRWITFLSPFREREGQAGFVYSNPVDHWLSEASKWDLAASADATGLSWFPDQSKDSTQLHTGYTVAWSCFRLSFPAQSIWKWQAVESDAPLEMFIDGQIIQFHSKEASVKLEPGYHELALLLDQRCTGWKLTGSLANGEAIAFNLPHAVHGGKTPWLYLGPMDDRPDDLRRLLTLNALPCRKKPLYWRLSDHVFVRPYLENLCFGRWNYPLGVTLFGLLQTSRMLHRKDIEDYVLQHLTACVSLHEYSLWDEQTYGFSEINAQLVHMHMLDDCGSFGALMLEAAGDSPDESTLSVAHRIADHMLYHQERKPDGAFYRKLEGYFMENTLWVDDLYMSIPFLIRYSRLTQDERYLEDAVHQFLLYRQYLFMKEQAVMSHVYDFKYGTPTRIPWGRGNGWCLFSLAELLSILPDNHSSFSELRSFFNQLCRGYTALQAQSGLWHQVLTRPDAYEESSCTAMFVYAFCRGLRLGLIEPDLRSTVAASAERGWQGLCEKAIDAQGNIYGICGGSCYSFSPDYYLHELGWIINDPHGIGIVLLAGIEMLKWQQSQTDLGKGS